MSSRTIAGSPGGAAGASVHLARWVLSSYLLTFLVARIVVLMIMTHRMPDLFLYIGGTHIHHLNFGIFLVSGVGAYLLFGYPKGRKRTAVAVAYGIGLALTFDEFGMWLHLGGSYWQRASIDAVALIGGLLGLLVFAPRWEDIRPRHWGTAAAVAAGIAVFSFLLLDALTRVGEAAESTTKTTEAVGPR